MTKYDTEQIALTPRFVAAIEELLRAEMEMMRQHEPDNADCWTWGICEVSDLSKIDGLSFQFGGEEDKPADFPTGTDVWVKEV